MSVQVYIYIKMMTKWCHRRAWHSEASSLFVCIASTLLLLLDHKFN